MPFQETPKMEQKRIGENKKRLLELEKEGRYVFHGSPYTIEKLKPRQATNDNKQTGQEENDGEPAIFASPFVDVAIFRSMVNEKIHSGDSSSGMGINDNNVLSFSTTQELVEEAKKITGKIYVFKRKDFIEDEARGLDLRCNEEISPIEIIEVNYKDLPENIKIIK